MDLIETILRAGNLTDASREVIRNKGAAGIDKMSVKELKPYLDENREELTAMIRNCMYIPQAIRGKEIPKGNGKTRLLGIPTVIDRMLQQAVSRTIMAQYEYEFSSYSFGFRPQRNAHQAIRKSIDYINSGHQHIVEIIRASGVRFDEFAVPQISDQVPVRGYAGKRVGHLENEGG